MNAGYYGQQAKITCSKLTIETLELIIILLMNINNSVYAPKYGTTFKDEKFFEYFLIETLRIINTIKKLATFSTRPARLYGTA